MYKEGFLVWGKVQGYSYWPGIVTVDPIDALTVKFRENTNLKCADEPLSHVHFLGYDNQRAWLPGESHVPTRISKTLKTRQKGLQSNCAPILSMFYFGFFAGIS